MLEEGNLLADLDYDLNKNLIGLGLVESRHLVPTSVSPSSNEENEPIKSQSSWVFLTSYLFQTGSMNRVLHLSAGAKIFKRKT